MTILGTPKERSAAAGVLAIVAGLLLAHAGAHSEDRAILVQLIFTVLAGLILGTGAEGSFRTTVAQALLPSALIPLSYCGYWLLRFLADWIKYGEMPEGAAMFSGTIPMVSAPGLMIAAVASSIWFAFILLLMTLSSLGSRTLIRLAQRVYAFGPEGFNRTRKIVLAIGAVAAAVAALWLAVG